MKELIETYGDFGDSIIKKINYDFETNKIVIDISVINLKQDYKWDLIQLIFIDISEFRFLEIKNVSNSVIMNLLIKNEDDIYTFDFFPINLDGVNLIENKNSDFLIKSKGFDFKQIL